MSLYMLFAKQKLRVFTHLIHQPLLVPWEEKRCCEQSGFRSAHKPKKALVFFASLLLCVSHSHPSHGLRGPCYGDATESCYRVTTELCY